MNSKPLIDFYWTNEDFQADLTPIEPIQKDINNIKGSIHLIKFEQDNVYDGNWFSFALRNNLNE